MSRSFRAVPDFKRLQMFSNNVNVCKRLSTLGSRYGDEVDKMRLSRLAKGLL